MYSLVWIIGSLFILFINISGTYEARVEGVQAPFRFMRGSSKRVYVTADMPYLLPSRVYPRGSRNKGSYLQIVGEPGQILRVSCRITFPTQTRVSREVTFNRKQIVFIFKSNDLIFSCSPSSSKYS